MLSKPLINTLQLMNSITNSIILKYPVTVINNPAGDVVAKINIQSIDPDEFSNIGIFNLSEFISTFKLFNDYTCSINDNIINIKDDTSSLQYLSTSPNVLENFDKSEKLFDSTNAVPSVSTFTVSVENMKTIKSAANIFKDLSDIIIESQDGDIFLKLGSSNNFNAQSNSFGIKIPSKCTKEFKIKIPAENFMSIPLSEYEFKVKYNSERDAYRLILKSTESSIEILMAIKK